MNPVLHTTTSSRYELWFRPLSRTLAAPRSFRCDATGHIDLDALSDRERGEYLYARALVGRDFDRPAVRGIGSGTPPHPAATAETHSRHAR